MISQESYDFMYAILKAKTDEHKVLQDRLSQLKGGGSFGNKDKIRKELEQINKETSLKLDNLKQEADSLEREIKVYQNWYKQIPYIDEDGEISGYGTDIIRHYRKMNKVDVASVIRAIFIDNRSIAYVAKVTGRKEENISRIYRIVRKRRETYLAKSGLSEEEIKLVLSGLEGK